MLGSTQQNNREEWIDTAKGLALIFVLIGHSTFYEGAAFVYIFHIPLFFFLSGYVFSGENRSTKEFINRKITGLLIPYYVLGIFVLIANTIINIYVVGGRMDYLFKITDQKERIIHYFTQERFGVLWYISAIFWMNLILFGLYRLFRGNKLALLIASIVMAVVAQVYYYGGGKSVIFNLDIVCAMFVFFVCGYIARKIDLFSKLECNYIAWFLLCIIIALVVGSFNNFHIGDRVDIYYNQYGIAPIMYLAAAFGTLGISCLCHKIHSRGLAYLGRNSMIIYAWHQTTVFTIVQEVFKQALGRNFAALQYRIAEMFVSMVLSLVIFIAVTEYISRTKAAKYFGVKQQELIDRQ